jgi:sulfite exporter TauE/SafE
MYGHGFPQAHFALLATVFSGTMEVTEHIRQRKDVTSHIAAGALTGFVSAFLVRPFQLRAVVKNSAVLGTAAAAYFYAAQQFDDVPSLFPKDDKQAIVRS